MNNPIDRYAQLRYGRVEQKCRTKIEELFRAALEDHRLIMNLGWTNLCIAFNLHSATPSNIHGYGWGCSHEALDFRKQIVAALRPAKPFNPDDYL